MSAIEEAAGSMLEEEVAETASPGGSGGVSSIDTPGVDLGKYVKKALLSTSPNPDIEDVRVKHDTDTGGAYILRGLRKMADVLPGFGSGPNPAILDVGIGAGHKTVGGSDSLNLGLGGEDSADDEPDDDEGPATMDTDQL